MRPRNIVVIALAVLVIGGFLMNNGRSDQAQFVQQGSESADQATPARAGAIADVIARQERALEQKAAEEERALTRDERALAQKIAQEERALAQKAAREEAALRRNGGAGQQGRAAVTAQPVPLAAAPQAPTGDTAGVQPEAGLASDDAAATSDQAASGAPVEGPATDMPVVSGADDTATGTSAADEADTRAAVPTPTPDAAEGSTDRGMEAAGDDQTTADTIERTASKAELEHLLKPENFDHDAIVALIEDADELSLTKRLALRALVEGATAASAMAENAIGSIRVALDLPPLD